MEETIQALEEQVSDLIRLCKKLRDENVELRQEQNQTSQEVERLQSKNRAALDRVEQISQNLRALNGS